jgi:hypothetical protein
MVQNPLFRLKMPGLFEAAFAGLNAHLLTLGAFDRMHRGYRQEGCGLRFNAAALCLALRGLSMPLRAMNSPESLK